jgi:glycosyltransferase involved in cell wall biosynthesis
MHASSIGPECYGHLADARMFSILQKNMGLASYPISDTFDVVHCHDVRPALGAVTLADRMNRPLVYTKHSFIGSRQERIEAGWSDDAYSYFLQLEKWVTSQAAAIIAVSQAAVDELIENHGSHVERKATVIRNGVSNSIHAVADYDSRPRHGDLLCVGRLTHTKGQDVAVEAMRSLPTAVRLRLLGDGETEEALRQQIHASGLEDRVEIIKPVAPHLMASMYATADILIAPSRWDTFPLTVCEAQAAGVAVVAANIPGIAEQIEAGRTGSLFIPGDPISLASEVQKLLLDRRSKQEIEARATLAADGYSWDAVAGSTLDVYQSLT